MLERTLVTESKRMSWSEGPDGTVVDLSCLEVRELLGQYANSALPEELALDVERHLEHCGACFAELKAMRAEDELLSDALGDLRPDPPLRAKVARACGEVHRRAEEVANSLPERGWAIFRWGLALLSVCHFVFLSVMLEKGPEVINSNAPEAINELIESRSLYQWLNLTLFLLALFLLIGGRLVAAFESWLSSRLGKRPDPGPTRLGVLVLETLGILGVLATSLAHYLTLVT